MPTTAWKSPSATSVVSFGTAWSNPTNAYSLSGTTSVTLGSFGSSEEREWTGFGFTTTDIPSGATIDGIEVRWINARQSGGWIAVFLRSGGSNAGPKKYTDSQGWTNTDTDQTMGGASDTWSASLTDSDIRSSNFGVSMEAEAGISGDDYEFDQIEIRVHYTAGGTTISGSGAATTAAATASGTGTVATPEITWDTAASSGSISFSDGDRTATYNSTSGNPIAIATNSASSGKFYFEVEVGGSADANYYAGIAPSSVGTLGGYTDSDLTFVVRRNGQVWGGGSNIATVGSFSAGDVLGFAVDLDTDDAWIAINGTWQNSGDPGAGTNGITITGGTEFPVTCPRNGSTTLHADSSTWNYSAPSGFSQLPTTATISGTGAATVGAVTASGTAERAVTGSGAVTVGAATASGTAERAITGSGAATIAAVTVSGTAERSITGTGAATVASVTASGSAEREITGTGAATTGAVTVSGSGEVSGNIAGTGAATIGAITASGTAEREIKGTGAATIGSVTASGTAERAITGSGAATTGAVTVSGSGEVSGNIAGTGAATIAAVTASGTAERTVTGTGAATVAAVAAAGTAEREIKGSGAATVGAVTVSGTGALSGEVTGSGAATIAGVTASGTAERTVTGTGAATVGAVTADGTAAVQGPIIGTGAAEIAPVEASGTATRTVTGSGAATIAAVEASGSADRAITGFGAATIAAVETAGTGVVGAITGTGAATIAAVTVSGIGSITPNPIWTARDPPGVADRWSASSASAVSGRWSRTTPSAVSGRWSKT